jgi:phosphoenolpyruvate synthase/pyruvate phosphate dikinase
MITHIGISTIVPLDAATAKDRARAGGKAFNCARLRQAGFPVPDGVIILSTASDADVATVAGHPWFDTQPRSASYAVRSSGIDEDGDGESFAGIHETYLDVPREHLADAVRRCRASALSAQALEYRRAKNISTDDINIGVLIQLMVHPIAAGVVFTVNPVTGNSDEMVINSSWGLGEALVSGQVDPDEFVVAKQTRRFAGAGLEKKEKAARRPRPRSARIRSASSATYRSPSSASTGRRRTSSGAGTARVSGSFKRVRSRRWPRPRTNRNGRARIWPK